MFNTMEANPSGLIIANLQQSTEPEAKLIVEKAKEIVKELCESLKPLLPEIVEEQEEFTISQKEKNHEVCTGFEALKVVATHQHIPERVLDPVSRPHSLNYFHVYRMLFLLPSGNFALARAAYLCPIEELKYVEWGVSPTPENTWEQFPLDLLIRSLKDIVARRCKEIQELRAMRVKLEKVLEIIGK